MIFQVVAIAKGASKFQARHLVRGGENAGSAPTFVPLKLRHNVIHRNIAEQGEPIGGVAGLVNGGEKTARKRGGADSSGIMSP
jgi:hypothetical protein